LNHNLVQAAARCLVLKSTEPTRAPTSTHTDLPCTGGESRARNNVLLAVLGMISVRVADVLCRRGLISGGSPATYMAIETALIALFSFIAMFLLERGSHLNKDVATFSPVTAFQRQHAKGVGVLLAVGAGVLLCLDIWYRDKTASSSGHVAFVAGSHCFDVVHVGPSDCSSYIPNTVKTDRFPAESAACPCSVLIFGQKCAAAVGARQI